MMSGPQNGEPTTSTRTTAASMSFNRRDSSAPRGGRSSVISVPPPAQRQMTTHCAASRIFAGKSFQQFWSGLGDVAGSDRHDDVTLANGTRELVRERAAFTAPGDVTP